MNASIERLKSQFRETPLIRFGVLLIVLIIAYLLLDTFAVLNQVQREDYLTALNKERQMVSIARQDFWGQRAEQARAARVESEGQLWRADTPGLARADLQSWLRRRQHSLKLDALQAQVERPEKLPALGSVWEVRGQLKGNLTANQLIQLLQQLELNSQLLRIRELRIKRRGPQLSLELVFAAYFMVATQTQD
jgi:hypothetical protein